MRKTKNYELERMLEEFRKYEEERKMFLEQFHSYYLTTCPIWPIRIPPFKRNYEGRPVKPLLLRWLSGNFSFIVETVPPVYIYCRCC